MKDCLRKITYAYIYHNDGRGLEEIKNYVEKNLVDLEIHPLINAVTWAIGDLIFHGEVVRVVTHTSTPMRVAQTVTYYAIGPPMPSPYKPRYHLSPI